jgi:hypothetical protein
MIGVHVSPVVSVNDGRLEVLHLALDGLNQLEIAARVEPLVWKAKPTGPCAQVVCRTL